MLTLTYTIDIRAPRQTVWDIMLGDETYRLWTGAFHEGSYYEGSWEAGSRIRFLAPEEDGTVSGMSSRIAANKPYEFLSIENLGIVVDGVEDTTSDEARTWAGSLENYTLTEQDGVTTLLIELTSEQSNQEVEDMFNGMWPPALQKLKQLCEA